jgi:hypothetical protein
MELPRGLMRRGAICVLLVANVKNISIVYYLSKIYAIGQGDDRSEIRVPVRLNLMRKKEAFPKTTFPKLVIHPLEAKDC